MSQALAAKSSSRRTCDTESHAAKVQQHRLQNVLVSVWKSSHQVGPLGLKPSCPAVCLSRLIRPFLFHSRLRCSGTKMSCPQGFQGCRSCTLPSFLRSSAGPSGILLAPQRLQCHSSHCLPVLRRLRLVETLVNSNISTQITVQILRELPGCAHWTIRIETELELAGPFLSCSNALPLSD